MDTNVGLLAIEVYFPSTYVAQTDLEVSNGVSSGKYTIGLGQDAMAFTSDCEDINSISLTVVQSLLEKYEIDVNDIGRLEIGTETLIDKSKSTKTVLMSLFSDSNNNDIEGATVINACYGGTAALLNALMWIDSSSWDGRYAIVVAADIAVYADGPARPTGGCGAVAMLVGRNALLKVDIKTKSTYSSHVWDFFKPNLDSEYPEVNGALSQTCYLRSLDACYNNFMKKNHTAYGETVSIENFDHLLFHSPYNKLVQKSFSRMFFQDIISGNISAPAVSKWIGATIEDTYEDKDLEKLLRTLSIPTYDQKVAPSCELSKQIGNTYTAALYMNLANLISNKGSQLYGQRFTLFSYGSGAIATLFEIKIPTISESDKLNSKFSLEKIQRLLDIPNRLASRERRSPQDLQEALKAREVSHNFIPFQPTFNVDILFPGTYYLTEINSNFERFYKRKPLNAPHLLGQALFLNSTITSNNNGNNRLHQIEEEAVGIFLNGESHTNGNSSAAAAVNTIDGKTNTRNLSPSPSVTFQDVKSPSRQGLPRTETIVWASGREHIRVVITGVSAALPGGSTSTVFTPGVDNIGRIINGENFITKIEPDVQDAMLEKNVSLLKRNGDGSQTKVLVKEKSDNIQLSASIGQFDLTMYGISESIAGTMDRAVQVAVAAGLEALKDAGIVSGVGEGLTGWILPPSMQDTTGIVYATSFPALDAAIAEVTRYFTKASIEQQHLPEVLKRLRQRLVTAYGPLSAESEAALEALQATVDCNSSTQPKETPFEFDRKFLFRVLVLGNAQLAQIVQARGPNMQTNAACAGSTQAVALAYDMIQLGRAERMIVIAGDNASSDTLMPWLGNGFRALGAATIAGNVQDAVKPFDVRRSGMILGAGGIGMILESEEGALRRHKLAVLNGGPGASVSSRPPYKCRLLASLYSNSAYHGASMHKQHIASEMERFLSSIERELGISRKTIAANGVYFSHETSTHASSAASCAANEIFGLRSAFGEDMNKLLILNTKGFTGHPMGVSFEDVVAAEVLRLGKVPPVANQPTPDPYLGTDINLSRGGSYPCKYALRFAAGFGSQIALALYGTADTL